MREPDGSSDSSWCSCSRNDGRGEMSEHPDKGTSGSRPMAGPGVAQPAPSLRGPPLPQLGDFSLVAGGPLYQLWRRARLSDDELHFTRRRAFAHGHDRLASTPAVVRDGGKRVGRWHRDELPAGHRSSCTHAGCNSAFHAGGSLDAPSVAPGDPALRRGRTRYGRHAPIVRGGHRLGDAVAQLGRGRGAADRVRVRSGSCSRMAHPVRARCEHLVCRGRR